MQPTSCALAELTAMSIAVQSWMIFLPDVLRSEVHGLLAMTSFAANVAVS